jgi:hypothetical protein|tara:strand:+ start:5937 stop:6104 length:168 start_codon:yes stop_codon:yes gene_type:complete
MFIFDWLYDLFVTISIIISVASIVAAATPSPKDDQWIGKFLDFVNKLALNFKIFK